MSMSLIPHTVDSAHHNTGVTHVGSWKLVSGKVISHRICLEK
jgi:hypothetical protein